MSNNKEKLFTEFQAPTTQEWLDKIQVDLKGADFNKRLVWRTNEGFNVQPFYRREDVLKLKTPEALPGEFPFVRGNKKDNNEWFVRQNILAEDAAAANAKALDVLNKGIDSLGFKIPGDKVSEEFIDTLLKEIECEYIEINFKTCPRHTLELAEILKAYFEKKGYDKTSTNDILDKVKIARGTLYYHFKSKEDILNAMIDRINSSLIARAEAVAKDKSVPIVERIVMTISSLRVNTDIANEIITLVHKPQNALMHQKMQKSLVEGVLPILTDLVNEGNKEGIFDVKYPKETTEMLILYSTIAFDDDYDESLESSKKRIIAFLINTERLLGAKEGSLQKAMMKLFN